MHLKLSKLSQVCSTGHPDMINRQMFSDWIPPTASSTEWPVHWRWREELKTSLSTGIKDFRATYWNSPLPGVSCWTDSSVQTALWGGPESMSRREEFGQPLPLLSDGYRGLRVRFYQPFYPQNTPAVLVSVMRLLDSSSCLGLLLFQTHQSLEETHRASTLPSVL